jgi:peptidyl-prolyl cis-trans isomerase D
MMAAFRAFAKSPLAVALFGLLIISFGVWGVRDVFKVNISNWVIQAGSREVSADEFAQIFKTDLRNLQQQTGQAITPQDAAAKGMDRQVLQGLVQQETLLEAVRRAGIIPSPQLVIQELRKIPAFFNPITGAFDERQYQTLLAQNERTPGQFEAGLKDEISAAHFSTGMTAAIQPPLTYAAVYAAIDQQSRSADYFVINPAAAGTPTPPTDADLQKLLNTYADRLRRPETRTISLVRFSAAALAPTLTADPTEVQKQFDFRKSSLSTPEHRSFVQVPAKDAAQAASIAARLGKGEDPSAVARAYGVKPLTYQDVPKATVPDPRIAEAAFKLQPGQVSGPLQGEFGFAVVKLQSITPAKPATLDQVRPQIEQQVNQKAAEEKVYDQVQKYEDVHSSGASMPQAAKAAGVTIFTLGPMTAEGRTLDGQQVQGLNPKMVADAFSHGQGGETDVIDLGHGEYYAIRVEKVNPPSLPSLDEIRPQLTQVFMQQQLSDRLSKIADGYVQRLKKGESVDAVAASSGVKVQHVMGLSRAAAQQSPQMAQALGREFLGRLFQAKTGDVFAAGGVNYSLAVVKVGQIQPGPLDQVAREAVAFQPQLGQQLAENDVSELVLAAASASVKPKVDFNRARQAIGLPPETSSAPASGAAKAPSKAP